MSQNSTLKNKRRPYKFLKMISKTFKILLLILITPIIAKKGKKVKLGPHWDHRDRTSCEEFGQHARFNPYSVNNETWFVFYYWAPQPLSYYLIFNVPGKKNYTMLHKYLDNQVTIPVNWTAKHLMVKMGRDRLLLVEQGDRGEYLLYSVKGAKYLPEGEKLAPLNVRMKQTGDNKVIGMMICQKDTVYALARLTEIPRQNQLQDAAARLNYRCRGGKSYLYRGHQWMPIPEQDEESYWGRPHKYFTKDTTW